MKHQFLPLAHFPSGSPLPCFISTSLPPALPPPLSLPFSITVSLPPSSFSQITFTFFSPSLYSLLRCFNSSSLPYLPPSAPPSLLVSLPSVSLSFPLHSVLHPACEEGVAVFIMIKNNSVPERVLRYPGRKEKGLPSTRGCGETLPCSRGPQGLNHLLLRTPYDPLASARPRRGSCAGHMNTPS